MWSSTASRRCVASCGPAALLRSLGARPSRRLFQMVDQAEDVEALRSLLVKPEVRARASDKAHLELLWEVAQVPDFRKLLMDTHVGLLAEVYLYLTGPQGAVPAELVARRIDRIDRVEGDIDTLTTRLAAIRTWTYLSHRRGWLEDAARHQARSREVEDRLSDALHEKLIQRFVDHRSAAIAHALARGALDLEVAADGLVRSGGQLLGALRGLDFEPVLSREKSDARALRKAARQALAPELGRRVVALVEAQHEEIGLDELGRLVWRDGVLGWWEKGEAPGLPLLKLAPLEMLGAGERQRVQRRLVAWSRDAAAEVVERLRRPEAEGLSPGGRGLVYELERRLGLVYRADVADLELVERDRRLLARLDVRLGAHCVYLANQFDPQLTLIRAALAAAWLGLERPPALPAPGQVSLVADGQADFYAAIGYPVVGPRALRVDMLERVAACLREAARRSGSMAFDLPRSLGDWMGCPLSDSIAVARALGWVVDAQGRCSSPDRLRRRAP
jgi:ATP-dependent RNA helicase SUPV3L1/SUV3